MLVIGQKNMQVCLSYRLLIVCEVKCSQVCLGKALVIVSSDQVSLIRLSCEYMKVRIGGIG